MFQLLLVTTTYWEGAGAASKSECLTLVLTIVWVIWWELRKVRTQLRQNFKVSPHITLYIFEHRAPQV